MCVCVPPANPCCTEVDGFLHVVLLGEVHMPPSHSLCASVFTTALTVSVGTCANSERDYLQLLPSSPLFGSSLRHSRPGGTYASLSSATHTHPHTDTEAHVLMPATVIKAAILGFGPVGQGIYNIAREQRTRLANRLDGVELTIVKVLVHDLSRADRSVPDGFDRTLLTDNIEDVFACEGLSYVFEATVGETPAVDYLRRAIADHHCSVVTANKFMFARHGAELIHLAELTTATCRMKDPTDRTRIHVGYEATVAGGLPIIKLLENMTAVQRVFKLEGIVNGSSNYILTKLRTTPSMSYDEVIQEAKKLGYLEADPSADILGSDAFRKLMILSQLVFGCQPNWAEVEVVGIDTITAEMVREADAKGLRYRPVAMLELVEEKHVQDGQAVVGASLVGCVKPMQVDASHPLFAVDNTTMCVTAHTEYLGAVTVTSEISAGMYPTACVMVEDFATFVRADK